MAFFRSLAVVVVTAGAIPVAHAEHQASPWGVSPSHELSTAPAGWAKEMAAAGVTAVRGFDVTRGVAGVTPLTEAGIRVSGFLMWYPPGKRTLPVQNLDEFRRRVSDLVTRYKGVVHAWEVWNEPPNFTEDRSPVSYGKLVAAAYEAAKAVDPAIQIGLSAKSVHVSFLAESIEGGARDKFDFISLHPYETAELVPQGWEGPFLGIVPSVRAMLREKNPAKLDVPIWFTELGVESNEAGRRGVSPEVQADTLVKLYVMGIAQGASQIHWFDPRDSENKSHGLLRGDGTPRPAYRALSALARALGPHPQYLGSVTPGPDSYGFLFQGTSGEVLVAWAKPGAKRAVAFGTSSRMIELRTGQQQPALRAVLTSSPVLAVAPDKRPFPAAWRGALKPSDAPAWDGPLGDSVTLVAGKQPKGLHMIDAPQPKRVRGVAEFDLAGRAATRFAVDPKFLSFPTATIRITAVVRGHGRGRPGFNLKYEYSGAVGAADDHGMIGTGKWNFVEGTEPITLSWDVSDARFVGKYGANFAIDSDRPELADFSLLKVSVTKLPSP